MSKLHKSVRISTFLACALFGIALIVMLVMNIAYPYLNDSLVNYAHFAKEFFEGLFGLNGVSYPADIFANVSLYGGIFCCLVGIIWMIVALVKGKKSGIAFFFACILLGFVFSYAAFLFVNMGSYNYFGYALANKDSYIQDVIMMIAFVALTGLTFVMMMVLCVMHLRYAVKEAPAKAPKAKKAAPVEAKPAEPVQSEKAVIFAKAPEAKPSADEEAKKAAEEAKKTAEEAKPAEKAEAKPAKKAEAKPAAKKAEAKPAAKKEAPKADKEDKEVKSSGKVYHISQHPTSNKWQVKLAKGEKALKLFNTQAEAIAYAKEVSKSQGGSIRVHSMEGKIRKA